MNIKSNGSITETSTFMKILIFLIVLLGTGLMLIALISPAVNGIAAFFLFLIGAGMAENAYKRLFKEK